VNWRYFPVWLLLSFYWSSVNGQNLILNPGFEDIFTCPDHSGQLTNAVSWINPNPKSPDLYHRCVGQDCVNLPFVCIPDNWVGNQSPFAGAAYAGLFVGGGNPNREYMQVPLQASLKPGETYVLTYRLSLADSYSHAIDRMGVYFSKEPVFGDGRLDLTPQSTSPPGVFLSDKTGWIEVQDTITADGGEAFLTIGNFYDEANTQFIDGLGGERASAYYYFDEFSLVPASATSPEGEEEGQDPSSDPVDEPEGQEPGITLDECKLFIPSAFSPNADGVNDVFATLGDCIPDDFELLIFNRWGARVFNSSRPDYGWDGSIRGRVAPPGVYLYFLRNSVGGEEGVQAGELILVR
jgi:gliding motility-associated-like protein